MFLIFNFWTWVVFWAMVNLVIAAWAYSDAKDRGDKSPGDWVLIILGLGILGLALYFVKRPIRSAAPASEARREDKQISARYVFLVAAALWLLIALIFFL